jgi:hypothetical protein
MSNRTYHAVETGLAAILSGAIVIAYLVTLAGIAVPTAFA